MHVPRHRCCAVPCFISFSCPLVRACVSHATSTLLVIHDIFHHTEQRTSGLDCIVTCSPACIAATGLNKNQGQVITAQEIEQEADELRLACRDALCRSKERRKQFSDAVYALETEDTLPK